MQTLCWPNTQALLTGGNMFTMAALYFKLYVESHHHDNYGFFGPILLLLTFVNMIIGPFIISNQLDNNDSSFKKLKEKTNLGYSFKTLKKYL